MNYNDRMKSFKFSNNLNSDEPNSMQRADRFSLYPKGENHEGLHDKTYSPRKKRSFSSRIQKTQTSSSFSLGEAPFQKNKRKKEASSWAPRKDLPRTTPAIQTWENSSQTSVQKRLEGYNRTSYKASRYTPTKLPDPIVPEKKEELISKGELLASMKKPAVSYLLFSKHTWVEEENLKHSVEESIIPKSLMEEEIEKPAVEKKNKKVRSKSVLEKSLKGIFEEEQTPFFNRYFEK